MGFILGKELWCFLANLSVSQMRKLRPTQRKWFAQDHTGFSYLCLNLSSPRLIHLSDSLHTLAALGFAVTPIQHYLSWTSLTSQRGTAKTTRMSLKLLESLVLSSLDLMLLVSTPSTLGILKVSQIPSPRPPQMGAQFQLTLSFTPLRNHLLWPWAPLRTLPFFLGLYPGIGSAIATTFGTKTI